MAKPSERDRNELSAILRTVGELLSRPNNDFAWSGWRDYTEAITALDACLGVIDRGELPSRFELAVWFAPTGPLQETSLSSGWSDEFMELAGRFDDVEKRIWGADDGPV
jgi:hypothetical protein